MLAVNLGTRRLRALERGAPITPEEQAELVRLARLGQQLAAAAQQQARADHCSRSAMGMSCMPQSPAPRH